MYFFVTCAFPAFYPQPCPAGKRKVSKAADKRSIKWVQLMARAVVYSHGNMLRFLVLASLVLYGKWVFGLSSEGRGFEQEGQKVSKPRLAPDLRGRWKAMTVSLAETLLS